MFCWQCISIHPCNENQLDALFILSLFRQSTSTCFGHICSPSSGVLYIYNWYVLCFSVDCLLAGYTSWWWATNMSETCRGWLTNKLWINSASSRFSLHGYFGYWCGHLQGWEQELLAYLLTPWSRVLLEKLTGFQLVKKFPAFYGTRRFITAFTSARHLSPILSQFDPVHTPHSTS